MNADLAHPRLAPHPSVRPAFESHLVVALLPHEQRARGDVPCPLHFVEPAQDRLELSLPDGFEDYVCVARIADVYPRVGRCLDVLCRRVKHGAGRRRELERVVHEKRASKRALCNPSPSACEEAYIREPG